MKGIKRLLLMALIGWLGVACSAAPPKPGCAPGSGMAIATACQLELDNDAATLAECDARVTQWETRCLR